MKGMCEECGTLVDTDMKEYSEEFSEHVPGVHADMSAQDNVLFCRLCAEDWLYIQD